MKYTYIFLVFKGWIEYYIAYAFLLNGYLFIIYFVHRLQGHDLFLVHQGTRHNPNSDYNTYSTHDIDVLLIS